jgi:hypothetical protein
MKLIKRRKPSPILLPNESDKIYKFFELFVTIGLLPIPLGQTTHAKIIWETFSL